VLAGGLVSIYPPRGEMQLQVLRLEPLGQGLAERQRRQLLEKLRAQGYLETDRKRPLPAYPQRIGIVTSVQGAAIRDMLELFRLRWPLVELVVRHSTVQGETAPAELAAAIAELNLLHQSGRLPVDLIIVARGGGSSEDLAAFDTEIVAEAIVHSGVPVVSAVGHEIDVTIADLVADCRAETPSAAVLRTTPDRQEKLKEVQDLAQRLRQGLLAQLQQQRAKLRQLCERSAWQYPRSLIHRYQQQLDESMERLSLACQRLLQLNRQRCGGLADRLQALSPYNVLQRGYSLTLTEQGQIVRQASQVQAGHKLLTLLAAGRLHSTVTTVEPDSPSPDGPETTVHSDSPTAIPDRNQNNPADPVACS
ncbi:MAG: exodeoxyribonuclease VII large subunit, partial [Gemmataceae bacterium]|nr:exodeoxyribonuclease VII large subunit [Gemmataceae bacterium]